MPDYGHDLVLGTFLTPAAKNPQQVVALAQTSERAGLDLVTFQDHPYQPAFLDTWTLLSWVAASTDRIQVAGNVLNLPLRPPAVLARAAASLDLLSGGRFALGLGSGAFWDAIVAMGSPRLTPGQGVDALDEAIDIIRGIWDTNERRPAAGPRDVPPGRRRQARSGARPRHPDLARRVQAADARPRGPQGRRLAAEPRLPEGRRPGRGERADRRVGAGGRPRPARDPTPAEPRRRVVLGRRLPPGTARAVGRGPAPPGPRGRHLDVHPGQRRPRDHRAVRRGGRARPARRRRGRAGLGRDRDRHRPARGLPGQAAARHRLRRPARVARRDRRGARRPRVRPRAVVVRLRGLPRAGPATAGRRGGQRRAGVRAGTGRAVRGAQRWARDQRPVDERRRHRHRRRRARHRRGARPRAAASSGSVRAPAGATWLPRCPRTGWPSAPATTGTSASAAW